MIECWTNALSRLHSIRPPNRRVRHALPETRTCLRRQMECRHRAVQHIGRNGPSPISTSSAASGQDSANHLLEGQSGAGGAPSSPQNGPTATNRVRWNSRRGPLASNCSVQIDAAGVVGTIRVRDRAPSWIQPLLPSSCETATSVASSLEHQIAGTAPSNARASMRSLRRITRRENCAPPAAPDASAEQPRANNRSRSMAILSQYDIGPDPLKSVDQTQRHRASCNLLSSNFPRRYCQTLTLGAHDEPWRTQKAAR